VATTKKASKKSTQRKPAAPRRRTAASDEDVSVDLQLQLALAALKKASTKKDLGNMQRFGIETADKVLGVSVSNIQKIAKPLGRSHELAGALWATGVYEARMMTAFVDEPDRVTPVQMDRWAKDFDNWAVVDTLCFHLFDRTEHAWAKVKAWSDAKPEFIRRASYALIAGLALHDKSAGDQPFLEALKFIERAASDDRNFVKKGVSWALRVVGRRNAALNAAAVKLSERLAASDDTTGRWIGKGALKELTGAVVKRKLAAQGARKTL
jgi:3-methyladenine DNA glycosylase AlkD